MNVCSVANVRIGRANEVTSLAAAEIPPGIFQFGVSIRQISAYGQQMIRFSLFLTLFASICAGPAVAEEKSLFVSYEVNKHIRSGTDDRDVTITIYLAGANGFGYRRQEWIRGAIDPVVKCTTFSNEGLIMSPDDQSAFGQALLDAGVFDLNPPPSKSGNPDETWWLSVRIRNREDDFHGYTAPTTGVAQAVDAVIRDYATRMKADVTNNLTTVSEGDLQPTRDVTLTTLLTHADDFDGKRVSVTGYFHGEFEGQTFCEDKEAATTYRYNACVWLGQPSSFAAPEDVPFINDSAIRVDGVFFKGPAGHKGLWPGEIERLTVVRRANLPQ